VIVGRIKRELTLSASRHSVTYGEHVRLTVDLELDDHGGSRDVRIVREQGGRRRLVGTITVSDNGVGSLVDEPIRNSTYRAIVLSGRHPRPVGIERGVRGRPHGRRRAVDGVLLHPDEREGCPGVIAVQDPLIGISNQAPTPFDSTKERA
jgi:hypothetical protein